MAKRRRRSSSATSSSSSSTSSSSFSTSSSSSCSTTFRLLSDDSKHLFGIMVAAALKNPTSYKTLIISLLSKSHISIFYQHIPLFISLLPIFMNSKCSEIACSGLEIVGAASLFSIEMNEQIALDDDIVKVLINAVRSCNRSVSMAACNAILDLFTTSVGRFRLLELSAVDNLIFHFLQIPKSSTPSVSLSAEEVGDKTFFRMGFVEDEYPILLLQVAITLINECMLEQLRKVSRGLSKVLLAYLATLWAKVRQDILIDAAHESERLSHLSGIRTTNLAESIFRLSMEETFTTPSKFQEVKESIFHLGQNSFESFIVNHWEQLPLLIKRPSNASSHENVFSSFSQFLRSKETVSSFFGFLFQNLVSALPINSDELDIISFLKESRESLGCPLIYQQDIRVVKTLESIGEMHFFQGSSLNSHDILRCEEAYHDGYTFAMRGMEFHFEDIAAISEGLAFLFGQPSTGVNMYLTPPNSQGLARHRDDHCVLVCQIRGVKRWKVFPNPCLRLPRLYENVDDLVDLEGENNIIDGCKEFLLREGDILYIPRGSPHEACTIIDGETNEKAEFSLHLTLAIEIEPPFEWEGFVHVAVHHWGQKFSLSNHISGEYSCQNLHDAAVHLMHIAIKLIGDVDPTFRNASLVGAFSFPSITEDWFRTHQKLTFNNLLSKVYSDSNFNAILSNIEVAIRKNEDISEKFRWICHLDQKMSPVGIEDLLSLVVHQKDKVEAAFMEVKSKFCNEVVFDDIVYHYNVLLEKYRGTRKQYNSGMLSLNRI